MVNLAEQLSGAKTAIEGLIAADEDYSSKMELFKAYKDEPEFSEYKAFVESLEVTCLEMNK